MTPMVEPSFSLRQIALPAFGPSVLYGMANGAILPVVAFTARDLDASVAVAGLVAALVGIGSLVSNVPASFVTARFGERRAMVGAAVFAGIALLLCILARHVAMLAAGVFMMGMAGSVFALARQSFLIEAVPITQRARALSTLAGSMRIGVFVGPFAGAAMIHAMGLRGAYLVALVAMVGVGTLAMAVPDLTHRSQAGDQGPRPTVAGILRSHAGVFLTLGLGATLVSVLRSSRQVVIPLWAEQLGIAPATAALIYGFAAAIDMTVFYPAGRIMDLHGRVWVAVPCALLMGLALMTMPLTTGLASFVAVTLLLGFGNGIGSGIIMTLGADASPRSGRTQFLGIWRMLSDIGSSSGPVLLSAITAVASLAAGMVTIGALGLVAAAVFWRWVPPKAPKPPAPRA
jgi:MFS family permease